MCPTQVPKRAYSSFLTIIMATIFALSLVPVSALSATSDITVTIAYNANNGVGTLNTASETTTIPANSDHVLFELPKTAEGLSAPTGKAFLGWGEAADATKPVDRLYIAETGYNASTFTLTKNVYALWGDDANPADGIADALQMNICARFYRSC